MLVNRARLVLILFNEPPTCQNKFFQDTLDVAAYEVSDALPETHL
jgi:hypothetical protein